MPGSRRLGGACLWLFYGALAVGIWLFADAMAEDGKSTIILGLPEAPFMYAVSALFAFGVLVQAIIVLNDMRRAMAHGSGGILGAVVTMAAVAGFAWLWVANVDTIASWAQNHVGLTLTLIFVVMWLLTLVLIPIAAIMGIVGVISSALFVGIWPSLSAASTEVTDFLGSPQLATLPLFLMMGSFAQVADVAEDIYRLAHVLLGRLRGGLGLATIAGCAGFGALTGHSVSTTVTVGKVALARDAGARIFAGLLDRRLRRRRQLGRAPAAGLGRHHSLRAVVASLDRPALRRRDRAGPFGLRALSRHHRDLCAHFAAIGAGARERRSGPALGRAQALRPGRVCSSAASWAASISASSPSPRPPRSAPSNRSSARSGAASSRAGISGT